MQNAQENSKHYHDQKAKEPDFALHDGVLLRISKIPNGLSPKLFQRYEGPYYIVAISPNFTYKLRRCSYHKPVKSLIKSSRLVFYKDPFIFRDLPDVLHHQEEEPYLEPIQTDETGEAAEGPLTQARTIQ